MPSQAWYQTTQIREADRLDARKELVAAMTRPGRFVLGRLKISNLRRPSTLLALLEMLTDVTHEDWTGLESGADYRSYMGRLPSGMPVDIMVEFDFELEIAS